MCSITSLEKNVLCTLKMHITKQQQLNSQKISKKCVHYRQCWACRALSVTKLSLLAVFCSALQLSLFMFEIVAFCNGLQCNGVTGTPNLPWRKKVILY
jgi:hypothetical protein